MKVFQVMGETISDLCSCYICKKFVKNNVGGKVNQSQMVSSADGKFSLKI